MQNPLRGLPSVNELLENPQLKSLVERVNHTTVVSGARRILEDVRGQVAASAGEIKIPSATDIAQQIADWVKTEERPRLRSVINATGVILHTGLGRAPLADVAIDEMAAIARGYASLEIDLTTGKRSQRVLSVHRLLCDLTGAQDAIVVNNNAAATMITLAALANSREVIVSRGQLVEIGGSYRLPEVMASAGAILKEVGTTNKTRISDYAKAVNEQTACLMRVHPSNYQVVGFTESVPLADMIKLGRQAGVPVIDDIGSGALFDFSAYGLVGDPIASESIAAGVDLVLFSGDKMVGGPQCGIIVGKKEYVEQINRHPMMRAMRVGKLTLAALGATLSLLRDRATAENSHPLLMMLSTPLENLRLRSERLAQQISAIDSISSATAVEGAATLGGGSVPSQQIPTWCISLSLSGMSVDRFAQRLRQGNPAVMGRIQDGRLLLDLRTVPPRHDLALVEAVRDVAKAEPSDVTGNEATGNAESHQEVSHQEEPHQEEPHQEEPHQD